MINPLSPLIRLLFPILCLILLSPLHSREKKISSSASKTNAFWQHFLDHNLPIAQARAQILKHQGRLIQWQASLFPKIKTQALALPLLIEIESTQALLRPTTTQEIKIAQLSIEAAQYNLYATIENQIDLLRHAALDYLHAQQIYENETYYQKQWQSLLPVLEGLHQSNLFPNHDLSWAKTKALAQNQHVLQSIEILKQSQNHLETLTHLPLQRIPLSLIRSLAAYDESSQSFSSQPPPWHKRPEYRKILTQLESSDTQILLIPKLLHPNIQAFAKAEIVPPWINLNNFSTAQDEDEPSNRRSPDQSRSSIGLGFYWLIYDGGDTYGQYSIAQASRLQGRLFLAHWERQFESSWKIAHHTFITTQETLQSLDPKPSIALSSLQSLLAQGAISHREYLDSLLLSREREVQHLHLKKQKAAALLTLHALSGHNLRFSSPND
jgi:hypothetical protein